MEELSDPADPLDVLAVGAACLKPSYSLRSKGCKTTTSAMYGILSLNPAYWLSELSCVQAVSPCGPVCENFDVRLCDPVSTQGRGGRRIWGSWDE